MADDAERQRRHRERMRDAGMVQVSFLVPADRAPLLKRLAARYRAAHLASEPTDD